MVVTMRCAALLSGGKDSVLALHVAHERGYDITHAVTMVPEADDSWMFHVPNLHVVPLQAESMEIPLVEVPTSGEAESEVDDLEEALAELDVDAVVSGAVASEYQRTRIERVGHRLGLKTFTPLWHKSGEAILGTLIDARYEVRIIAVAADGFREEWLGRRITPATVEHLEILRKRNGIHIAGEGGEYETLVLDAPLFARRIAVEQATPLWERDHGVWHVELASLGEERERRRRSLGRDLKV